MDWAIFKEALTNSWWANVGNNYSVTISMVFAVLKAFAILKPDNPSNKILDLIQGMLFKK